MPSMRIALRDRREQAGLADRRERRAAVRRADRDERAHARREAELRAARSARRGRRASARSDRRDRGRARRSASTSAARALGHRGRARQAHRVRVAAERLEVRRDAAEVVKPTPIRSKPNRPWTSTTGSGGPRGGFAGDRDQPSSGASARRDGCGTTSHDDERDRDEQQQARSAASAAVTLESLVARTVRQGVAGDRCDRLSRAETYVRNLASELGIMVKAMRT